MSEFYQALKKATLFLTRFVFFPALNQAWGTVEEYWLTVPVTQSPKN